MSLKIPNKKLHPWVYGLLSLAVIIIAAGTLLFMGRVSWCECGYIKLWHGVVMSSENSQHISDWYTFSHVIHGFAFYGILWLFARRFPLGLRFFIAVLAESAWEVFENSNFIINRYRETTISLDYFGDSILNSVFDILFMVFGFWLARRLPILATIVLTLIMEVWVGYMIRDNLALNIIMLIYPFQSILKWQSGAI